MECNGKKYCDCASEAFHRGANRDVVDGFEDGCPYSTIKNLTVPVVAPSEEVKLSNPTEEEIAEFIKSAFQILVGGDKYKMMDYILDSKFRINKVLE